MSVLNVVLLVACAGEVTKVRRAVDADGTVAANADASVLRGLLDACKADHYCSGTVARVALKWTCQGNCLLRQQCPVVGQDDGEPGQYCNGKAVGLQRNADGQDVMNCEGNCVSCWMDPDGSRNKHSGQCATCCVGGGCEHPGASDTLPSCQACGFSLAADWEELFTIRFSEDLEAKRLECFPRVRREKRGDLPTLCASASQGSDDIQALSLGQIWDVWDAATEAYARLGVRLQPYLGYVDEAARKTRDSDALPFYVALYQLSSNSIRDEMAVAAAGTAMGAKYLLQFTISKRTSILGSPPGSDHFGEELKAPEVTDASLEDDRPCCCRGDGFCTQELRQEGPRGASGSAEVGKLGGPSWSYGGLSFDCPAFGYKRRPRDRCASSGPGNATSAVYFGLPRLKRTRQVAKFAARVVHSATKGVGSVASTRGRAAAAGAAEQATEQDWETWSQQAMDGAGSSSDWQMLSDNHVPGQLQLDQASPAKEQGPGFYAKRTGGICVGTGEDLGHQPVGTTAECSAQCDHLGDCAGFSWVNLAADPDVGTCYFLRGPLQMRVRHPDEAVIDVEDNRDCYERVGWFSRSSPTDALFAFGKAAPRSSRRNPFEVEVQFADRGDHTLKSLNEDIWLAAEERPKLKLSAAALWDLGACLDFFQTGTLAPFPFTRYSEAAAVVIPKL